jgi:hypothetical protein
LRAFGPSRPAFQGTPTWPSPPRQPPDSSDSVHDDIRARRGVLAVTNEEFAWFQDYFGRKTGIYFEDNKRYFVDRRLTARMQATGHKSCLLYLRFVQFQPSQSEYQKLVNAMTVNETYFFREEYQLSRAGRRCHGRRVEAQGTGAVHPYLVHALLYR